MLPGLTKTETDKKRKTGRVMYTVCLLQYECDSAY